MSEKYTDKNGYRRWKIKYLLNYANGRWSGPYEGEIAGKTLLSAWFEVGEYVMRGNPYLRYGSLIYYKAIPVIEDTAEEFAKRLEAGRLWALEEAKKYGRPDFIA